MASSSGGASQEWSNCLKPLLAASCGSFIRSDIPALVKSIITSETEILTHDDIHESFYAPFAALSAHYISSNAQHLLKNQINSTCQACRVLLQYFLNSLKKCDDQSCLLQKQIMSLIKGLCLGTGYLQRSDVITLTAMMKSAKLPSHISSFTDEPEEESRSVKRPRVDPSSVIVEQLMTPIHDSSTKPKSDGLIEMVDKDGDTTIVHIPDPNEAIKNLFATRNASNLQQLNAGDLMVDECLALPVLNGYVSRCDDILGGKSLVLPTCLAGAACTSNTFKGVMNDLIIVKNTVSLPILEPLTDNRLKKLTKLTMSCLYAALTTTTAHSIINIAGTGPISKGTTSIGASSGSTSSVLLAKDEDNDVYVASIVESSLEIFNLISTAIQASTRAGGHNLQNLQLIGAWMLMSGIQHILNLNPNVITEKAKESAKKTPEHSASGRAKDGSTAKQNLTKLQQGFGVLCVAVTNELITLLVSLLEDLKVEGGVTVDPLASSDAPAELNIFDHNTAWQRVLKLTTTVNLTTLLFNLASISYRKACILKRIQKHPTDGDTFSSSDSNTYYSDDFSCSDDNGSSGGEDADDDSEPILGKWFEETLSIPQESSSKSSGGHSNNADHNDMNSPSADMQSNRPYKYASNIIPEKGEPHGFIRLAGKIFTFINNHLVNSESPNMIKYLKQSFNEHHMVTVAGIIRDLDRESSRSEFGTISIFFGAVLGNLYNEFSQALSCFTHNLLATERLSENLQKLILTQLGVYPGLQGTKEEWPLQVYPRTLAIIAQVLLIRQQREKDDLKSESEVSVVRIWMRLLTTLKNRINDEASLEDNEDINVEHLQLLLFLFHNLQLMQKKGVLLLCAQTIIDVVPALKKPMCDMKLIYLSRVLLIFEYLMKNLYDASAAFIDQVHWNLFSSQITNGVSSSVCSPDKDNASPTSTNQAKQYFICKEVEENYRKLLSDNENANGIKPRFYYLSPIDTESTRNEESPKVDGLACSFILGTSETLNYSKLYESLIAILDIQSQCDISCRTDENKLSLLGLCAIQYSSIINWRLILSLPPSVSHFKKLSAQEEELSYPEIIHALIWVSRIAHETFAVYVKLSLVKQGLSTQQADALLKAITKNLNTVTFDIKLAKQILSSVLSIKDADESNDEVLALKFIPRFRDLCLLDLILAKIQVAQDKSLNEDKTGLDKAKVVAEVMLPMVFQLIEYLSTCARSLVLHQLTTEDPSIEVDDPILNSYNLIIKMSCSRTNKIATNARYQIPSLVEYFPLSLKSVLDKWNACSLSEFPAYNEWRASYEHDTIPSESYISCLLKAHTSTLSADPTFSLNSSLKHALYALVHFGSEMIVWSTEESNTRELIRVMFPLVPDAMAENLTDFIVLALERILGSVLSDVFKTHLYKRILSISYELIINHSDCVGRLDERIFHECLKNWEMLLDQSGGKTAIEMFFTEDKELIKLLLSASSGNLSPAYGTHVLKFFNQLFQLVEKKPDDKTLLKLSSTLGQLGKVDSGVLTEWLKKMISPFSDATNADSGSLQENRILLQNLTSHIVKDTSHIPEIVSLMILKALIPMATQTLPPCSDGTGVSELMVVMANLAGAGSGSGHVILFKACITWLSSCKKYLTEDEVIQKFEDNATSGKHQTVMESTCYLMSYINDIMCALKQFNDRSAIIGRIGATSPPCDGDLHHIDLDSDWAEDLGQDDDDSAAEDSDEDSLCNKLCSFTVTQKEFMNQHWYHCHTCKMVDSVGVCTVCAKVCHKDHDVTYAKCGSFFCDCGAKDDNSCQALTKRTSQPDNADPTSGAVTSGISSQQSGSNAQLLPMLLPSSLRRRTSSPSTTRDKYSNDSSKNEETSKHRQKLMKQLEGHRDNLISIINSSDTVEHVLEMIQSLMSIVNENCKKKSSIGSISRIQNALNTLHSSNKSFEMNDQLMVPTLGSQEGAFENVRMNYSGDQGQTIRHLICTHSIRRVAMCCLSSIHGRRQHLAVSHEKGKITVLQLSALLKQSDSSKRKLTLTRLASAPVPFTVLSITGNPCNEDFLAVCGLKDCHVLTFSSTGSVCDHLVLHPQLDTANYIIKAIWLPGSQTSLALITADFVKIYDLSKDALSPQYYFLLPTSKIKDCCFMFTDDGQQHLLLMCTTGNIYSQLMSPDSSAQHGPFYVTSIHEVPHPEIKDKCRGQIFGGGVSIYYSHTMQLLFFSYVNGKSFIAPLKHLTPSDNLINTQLITYKSMVGSGNSNKGSTMQPLCQWGEIPGHPGLVTSLTQSTNNPVILMIKPHAIYVQEIKVLPAKTKITDMVTIRHPSTINGGHRTTLILLCEDGSLRIYMAGMEQTGFWFSPALNSADGTIPSYGSPAIHKSLKKKKIGSSQHQKSGRASGSVSFAVDYFEHAQNLTEIEFGGNDVLQVYNTTQLKHRLNTTGLYIASTKPTSFNIEVINNDSSMVMVGIRILVGTQDVQRAPSYVEIMGRTQQMSAIMSRSRWFDFPLTREESLMADKKITIVFGSSADLSNVTMIDTIKVYGRSKEVFGWPEESEELLNGNIPAPNSASTATPMPGIESEGTSAVPAPISSLDRLVGGALEVLDCTFSVMPTSDDQKSAKQTAIDIATDLLTFPASSSVTQHAKTLLAVLHPNLVAYNNHKDQAVLKSVNQALAKEEDGNSNIDGETFFRIVITTRSIAVSRPSNLVRLTDNPDVTIVNEQTEMEVEDIENSGPQTRGILDGTSMLNSKTECSSESQKFILQLVDTFWKLHSAQPSNSALAPVCQPMLNHVEMMVQALVDIIHAFTTYDLDNVQLASKLYVHLLLCADPIVSFACKQALIRVLRPRPKRRRVFIPSPPHCSTPGVVEESENEKVSSQPTLEPSQSVLSSNANGCLHPASLPPSEASQESSSSETEQHYEVVDPMVLLAQDGVGAAVEGQHGAAESLEALFPPMLDIPPDADDETMVELAIALSLQDQPGQSGELNLQGLSSLAAQAQRASSLEGGHYSDSTASVGASDDEGSTAATDGSTLRTSPAEQGGSAAGSESGGSAVDSIITEHNVSGRSSAYGDNVPESVATGARSETSSLGVPSTSLPQESDILGSEIESCDINTSKKLHTLRLMLLEKLLYYMPELRDVGGVRIIPFMQVLLMLSSDVNVEEEKDRTCLDNLVSVMISELNISATEQEITNLVERTPRHEVQLVIMRLLSVMMSRSKAGTLKPASSGDTSSSFISNTTANALLTSGAISFCLTALKALLNHWKSTGSDANKTSTVSTTGGVSNASNLLKPQPALSPAPDMSPFFLRQYVRGHANDVFEAYPQLLNEMVFRLPYQMKKIINQSSGLLREPLFDQSWYHYLCEYMMTQQTPFVRRQVRKLLLFICGSKDKYRQLRDLHALESHMKEVKLICHQGGYGSYTSTGRHSSICLPYDSLITLIEHLKACTEVATSRTTNWQKFCMKDESVLAFLMQVSFLLDEGISPIILQLLQCAICGAKSLHQLSSSSASSNQVQASKSKKLERTAEKSTDEVSEESSKFDEAQCLALVLQVNRIIDKSLLRNFIQAFLLESNQTSVRWQAHSLVLNLFRNSATNQQEALLDLLWKLWPLLSSYGRKAAQFVDVLGYFTLKMLSSQTSKKTKEYVEKAVELLRTQNGVLGNHPNANIYNSLLGLVEFDGFYLESDPCLVCNNPEVAFTNVKLSAIKVDSRFTTTTQIVKLVGSHTISKIILKIQDLKRTKMVRTINVYYNNRSVQAVVELKNKLAMWHKAKTCTLTSGQTEVKIEFPLPIVACNLMVEYSDFYENIQASSETLQCPRCSASVPANPGVCANCGENVFQCHKCRSINYDERDPFLCNACGFCKYAKFEYTLTAKSCSCSTDPIENDEDRKKTVAAINSLLEKADRVYKQLIGNKTPLEALLMYINDRTVIDSRMVDSEGSGISNLGANNAAAAHPGLASVSRAIQQLAQRYCGDCKSLFDELSKIIQKVLASRKELVDYDRQQKGSKDRTKSIAEPTIGFRSGPMPADSLATPPVAICRCYGCASAATEYCITLLRALATNPKYRQMLCNEGQLLRQLVEHNLRRGSLVARYEVRQLLCLLTKDNIMATNELNTLIMEKISTALKGQLMSPDLVSSIRHELGLLATSVQKEDSCWEQKLRCVMKLFLLGVNINTPVVLESLTLPCLNILQSLIKPALPATKKNKDKPVEAISSIKTPGMEVQVNVKKWLAGHPEHSYKLWKQRASPRQSTKASMDKNQISNMSKQEVRARYLVEKYSTKWKNKVEMKKNRGSDGVASKLKIIDSSWLRSVMFCPSSRSGRQAACTVVESLFQIEGRKKEILNMLTKYLDDVGKSGESAAEFLMLYQNLMQDTNWKYYLAVKGVLPYIGNLITKEIEQLTTLEDRTLNSDLSQGYALKMLTELLSLFLDQENIKHCFKGRLVGTVLNGYLSLRKLVIQRTKLIDETQDKLLDLLEGMTTGTESETRAFMSVCVETVKKYPEDDMRTPLFIFERLCSIIHPEENDVGEFYMTLEKDPQQEDFLQGRMPGNPYCSSEPGLGPLMRDVKNKICQDCELVALLEDDSGMELLVNNKIISLDLPVKEVYKKIWCTDNNDVEAMRIVYRMRGLLGDATEEFIETLDAKNREEVDNEEVYKMANVMSYCGGLEVMLQRLSTIENLSRGRSLLTVLLKLFCHCIKVKANRQKLTDPSMKTIEIMLGTLKFALVADSDVVMGSPGGPTITEQLLQIMESVLVEACHHSSVNYSEFSATCGDETDIRCLLGHLISIRSSVAGNSSLLQRLMRVLPFLSFGSNSKMQTIIDHFKPFLNFNKFDYEHSFTETTQLECFSDLAAGIEENSHGNQLKDMIVKNEIVKEALEYITMHAPPIKTIIFTDSDEWKEFVGKPALKYVLKILTGLSLKHEVIQNLISADCVPIMHRLEQMSSNEHVGSLAENLIEALKENPNVAQKIEQARRQTKSEKKRLAMAMREKQLGALGMKTNEKGQVKAKSSILTEMGDLMEETGLVCVICREGYKFQPTKVLGIYTFTKRVNMDDYENKIRNTPGYVSVSHFNVVHVDCHMSAVRLARGRDEWESAALQNANTKCNGLLPLWGPQVLESNFASCLARHNTYLQECTGHRDISYSSTIHDLKLLLQRFGHEKSFSDESGGGGPQSNMHLVPYLIHMALYVINTTRSVSREEKNVTNFLQSPSEKWIENSFEVESAYYWTTMCLICQSTDSWKQIRTTFLKRLLATVHIRHVQAPSATQLNDKQIKDYSTVYKPGLLFFGLVNGLYTTVFKNVIVATGGNWSSSLADYIRHNDQALIESTDRLLQLYQEDMLTCQSFAEFCDVAGLLEDIPEPDKFLTDCLSCVP